VTTIKKALVALAQTNGVLTNEILEAKMREHFGALSDRYRRLAADVLMRLPENWDSHASWFVREGDVDGAVDHLFAGSRLTHEEDLEALQTWEVVLSPARLAGLSDKAVHGVIAHELGHVASALETDPRGRNEEICEDRADAIATWWGFAAELDALSAEAGDLQK
jgi:hypothetical protein